MGSGYVIEHCVAAIRKSGEEKAFKIYVTDALKHLVNNSASDKKYIITKRFAEIIDPKPEETRTSDDIIDGIKGKIGRLGNKRE